MRLVETYGSDRVDFYPHGMSLEHVYPIFSTMKQALEYLYNPVGKQQNFKHGNMFLFGDIPYCFFPAFLILSYLGVYHKVDSSENGTYIQWNTDFGDEKWNELLRSFAGEAAETLTPDLFNDKWMKSPQCFSEDEGLKQMFKFLTHWKMLIIGEKGAGLLSMAALLFWH